MGGGQALEIGLRHLDRFSAIGVFSSGIPQRFEERFGDVLGDSKRVNGRLKLFWIGIGTEDGALARNRELRAVLEKRGVRFTGVETEGGHFYPVWRRYLTEVAPLLFR
jgi:enterochelin esterase family protein